jgi:catechol 2,3-dioxygenase-like lactoylglutathione lyase family enzyme
MKVPFVLGEVGHFGLAVRDPKKSAKWFERGLGLRKEFEFENSVAVGNENVTIALFKGKPSPETIDHVLSFAGSGEASQSAAHLQEIGADIEDPGNEIGPEAPGSRTWDSGSTILTVIGGTECARRQINSGTQRRACRRNSVVRCALKVPALTRCQALSFLSTK